MRDFEPEQVVNQIEPLKKLAEARKKLSDLMAKMDGNDRLVELMDQVIQSTDALHKINKETSVGPAENKAKEDSNGSE
jgi:type VI secretion system protein ImpB